MFIQACLSKDTAGIESLVKTIHIDVINSLIQNPRRSRFKHTTALILAVEDGNQKLVDLLLQHGANPNIGNEVGPPIVIAMLCDEPELFESLIRNGAVANLNDEFEVYDILFTIFAKSRLVTKERVILWIKVLVKTGCNINYFTSLHQTPLCSAPLYAVGTMLKYGADLNIENHNNQISLFYLKNYSNRRISKNIDKFIDVYVHIEKLKLINTHISEKVQELHLFIEDRLRELDRNKNYLAQKAILINEADKLKNIKICAGTTWYDIVFKNINKFILFANNENLIKFISQDNIEDELPYFGNVLVQKFEKLIVRHHLVMLAMDSLNILCNNVLTITVLHKIIEFLDDYEVQKLITVLDEQNSFIQKIF